MKQRMKVVVAVLLIVLVILCPQRASAAEGEPETVNATILEVTETKDEAITEYHLTLRITEGTYRNQILQLTFVPIRFSQYDFTPKTGQTILLSVFKTDHGLRADVMGLSRQHQLSILFVIFFVLLLVFGRKKGMLSLIALGLTGAVLLYFLIPMILKGHNAVLMTVLSAVFIVVISFVIISGLTKKSFASILGTIGGIVCAVVIAQIFCSACGITGSVSEEAYLMVCDNSMEIDFAGLFISGVIIGTIGVVMDVSMSVTSVIFELKSNAPKMGFGALVASGIKVGKDMMATMINTLILAYVGTTMPLLFVFISNASSFKKVINMEIVAGEIVRSLCGSIGLILTVPLTALIASYLILRNGHRTPRLKRSLKTPPRHRRKPTSV